LPPAAEENARHDWPPVLARYQRAANSPGRCDRCGRRGPVSKGSFCAPGVNRSGKGTRFNLHRARQEDSRQGRQGAWMLVPGNQSHASKLAKRIHRALPGAGPHSRAPQQFLPTRARRVRRVAPRRATGGWRQFVIGTRPSPSSHAPLAPDSSSFDERGEKRPSYKQARWNELTARGTCGVTRARGLRDVPVVHGRRKRRLMKNTLGRVGPGRGRYRCCWTAPTNAPGGGMPPAIARLDSARRGQPAYADSRPVVADPF